MTEKVDTDINIDLNTLYKIYSEFRKDGLYPIDLKKENIGRLIKDNIIYWNKSINLDPKTKGFDKENEIVLKAGELVLLDTELIYTKEDIPLYEFGPSLESDYCEARYNREHIDEILKELNKKYEEENKRKIRKM